MRLAPVFMTAAMVASAFPAHAIEVLSIDDPSGRPAAGTVPPEVSFMSRFGVRVSVRPMGTLTELDAIAPDKAGAGFDVTADLAADVAAPVSEPAAAAAPVSVGEDAAAVRILGAAIDDTLDAAVTVGGEPVSFGLDVAPVFAEFARVDASPAAEPLAVADAGITFEAVALVVPEPGMLGLLGIGFVGIGAARLRRR